MLTNKLQYLLLHFVLAFSCPLFATNYYVSPGGSGSGTGTFTDPINFVTGLAKSLIGGDSLILRGGIYSYNSTQTISKSGTSAKQIHIIAYNNELPIFDFRTQVYSSNNAGIKLSGNYVHVKGITIQGAGDNGMLVSGSNNLIEFCNFRWNCDSGLQLKTGSNNLVINCDAYENFDYETGGTSDPDYGGNADGFADKQYTNSGTNTYKYCRAWKNSDDGWDGYEKIGNTVYDSCFCYANGPASFDMTDNIRFKTDSAAWLSKFKNSSGRYVVPNSGNGNGFKLGGNYTANNATLYNCVAVGNTVKGFDQNNNNGTMTLYNCTGYLNQYNYGFSNNSYGTLIIKNSASLSSTKSNSFNAKTVTQSYNSWNLGFSCTAADFVSLDVSQIILPRKLNGALPDITLLHLNPTSSMIDKGTNVGLKFAGSMPDLGAFEYGLTTANHNIIKSPITTYYNQYEKTIIINDYVQSIEIYNINGLKVFSSGNCGTNTAIPCANWSKGVYLVKLLTSENNTYASKILLN